MLCVSKDRTAYASGPKPGVKVMTHGVLLWLNLERYTVSASSLSVQNIEGSLADIAPNYDVFRAYLFGSCARGEQHAGSDVDLCLETGPTFSFSMLEGLQASLKTGWALPLM